MNLRTVLDLDPEHVARLPGYEPLRPGVDMLVLYRDEVTRGSAAVLRYQPGAEVPSHEHGGFEHVIVLDGEQMDERGRYRKGTLVINPPGTSHRVWSPGGCLVLIVWQRPVVFQEPPARGETR